MQEGAAGAAVPGTTAVAENAVAVGAKFGIDTVVALNGTLVEAKICPHDGVKCHN